MQRRELPGGPPLAVNDHDWVCVHVCQGVCVCVSVHVCLRGEGSGVRRCLLPMLCCPYATQLHIDIVSTAVGWQGHCCLQGTSTVGNPLPPPQAIAAVCMEDPTPHCNYMRLSTVACPDCQLSTVD